MLADGYLRLTIRQPTRACSLPLCRLSPPPLHPVRAGRLREEQLRSLPRAEGVATAVLDGPRGAFLLSVERGVFVVSWAGGFCCQLSGGGNGVAHREGDGGAVGRLDVAENPAMDGGSILGVAVREHLLVVGERLVVVHEQVEAPLALPEEITNAPLN
eukprot:COSAG01_NODE_5349_length_4316_cov_33.342898_2_plen_158_part_00